MLQRRTHLKIEIYIQNKLSKEQKKTLPKTLSIREYSQKRILKNAKFTYNTNYQKNRKNTAPKNVTEENIPRKEYLKIRNYIKKTTNEKNRIKTISPKLPEDNIKKCQTYTKTTYLQNTVKKHFSKTKSQNHISSKLNCLKSSCVTDLLRIITPRK